MPRKAEPALDARERRFGRGHKRVRAWDVAGDADDLTFVLVHGLGVSSSLFREVTSRLRHLGRVVVYDLPGFGGVPHPADPMSIGEFASVIEGSLDELGITHPVLVGHSMGAQVAAELAARDPRRRRVVLVAPVVCTDQRDLLGVLVNFLRAARHERFGSALLSVRGYLSAGLRWPLELLPSMIRYPVERRIAGMGGRLVIVRGDHDALCPASWADRLLTVSGATGRVIVAEGAGHQVVVDHADEVVAAAVAAAGRAPLP
ncbi:MAG: alpha/beta fold hydrolase [Propionibacteriaceae bacterium]|nr:alpha/beta fold hydrolase [Propionibacteriaceae bacterium]